MNRIIKISEGAGFCFGVKNAFDKTLSLAESANNICIYGEMVHNKYALNSLYKKGITIKENIKDIINEKKIEVVIIRAHGVSPEEEKILIESQKKTIDLTCPKVKNIQLLAKKLASDGYYVLIYGKENHPEVAGIKGYCPASNEVINNVSDINKINDKFNKIALISQTTMNSDKFKLISESIKLKYPQIEIYDTLCKAPITKQESAIKLANESDCMLVVGDKSSSNTITLFEKLKEIIPSFFIEKNEDIDFGELKKYEKIGIAGGSSTSFEQLEEIKNYIANLAFSN